MTKKERQILQDVLEAWETPDSPEALAYAMYELKRLLSKHQKHENRN